jgi:hypothetical protein
MGYENIETRVRLLPLRARLAFVARCVRRVQPLWELHQPDESPIETVVAAIERAAGDNQFSTLYKEELDSVFALQNEVGYPDDVRAAVAECAVRALQVFKYLAGIDTNAGNLQGSDELVLKVVHCADRAVESYAEARMYTQHFEALVRDLSLLDAALQAENWNDQTLVSRSFFGPLWPFGVPEGWPATEPPSGAVELVVELDVPDGVSNEEVIKQVGKLANLTDDLHRAYGGHGLKIKEVTIESEACVPEGANT